MSEENGIRVITGHTISEVINNPDDPDKIDKIILDNNEKLDCDLLIIAIGVRPRLDFLKDTEININRGIVVDNHMQTNIPGIYACGDCAEIYDFILDIKKLTPLWPTAYIGGMIAGFNMAGHNKEFTMGMNMNSMKFFGIPVMSGGLIEKPDDGNYEVLTRYEPENMIYKKIILKDNIVKGIISVNSIDRTGIIIGLMRNNIDVSSFKAHLMSDDFDLIYFPREIRNEIFTGRLL